MANTCDRRPKCKTTAVGIRSSRLTPELRDPKRVGFMMALRAFLLTALVCGGSALPTSGEGTNKLGASHIAVRVIVKDPRDHPVSGVRVVIELQPQPETGDTAVHQSVCVTGADGTCTARVARAGDIRVTAKADGYLRTLLDSSLTNFKSQELSLQIEKGGTLRGQVVDESDHAYAGTVLHVLKADDDEVGPNKLAEVIPPVKTDKLGNFVLPHVSTGYYVAMPDQQSEEWQKQIELVELVSPVHVEEERTATVTLLVRRLGRLEGTVEFGDEIPNAVTVSAVPFGKAGLDEGFVARHQVSVPTKGDPVVSYTLEGLSSGEYRVKVEADGYAPILTEDQVLLPVSGSAVVPPQFMRKGAAVHGTLRSAVDGAPIADTEVCFVPSHGAVQVARATTDADGAFTIGYLAAGAYTVTAAPRGFAALRRTVRIGAEDSQALDLRVPSGAVIEGLYAYDGLPQGGVEVLLLPVAKKGARAESALTQTDDEGRFRFRNLTSGKYSMILVGRDITKEVTVASDEVLQVSIDGKN